MSRKRLAILGVLAALFLVSAGVWAGVSNGFFHWGQQAADNQSLPADEIAARVNGQPISKERFETYKAGLSLTQAGYTDEQVLEKMIRREVLHQEIARRGVSVSDDEVEQFNDERFAMLEEDETAYQIVKDYVDGLGITMEEYKEMSLEVSRDSLLTTRYRELLLEELFADDPQLQTDSPDVQSVTLEEYYEQTLDALVDAADIEILE